MLRYTLLARFQKNRFQVKIRSFVVINLNRDPWVITFFVSSFFSRFPPPKSVPSTYPPSVPTLLTGLPLSRYNSKEVNIRKKEEQTFIMLSRSTWYQFQDNVAHREWTHYYVIWIQNTEPLRGLNNVSNWRMGLDSSLKVWWLHLPSVWQNDCGAWLRVGGRTGYNGIIRWTLLLIEHTDMPTLTYLQRIKFIYCQ